MPHRLRNTMLRRSYCSHRWTPCRPMTNSWMRWEARLSRSFSSHVEEAVFKCGKRSRGLPEEPRAPLDAIAKRGEPTPYVSAIEGASQHFEQQLIVEWFCEELDCTLFHR